MSDLAIGRGILGHIGQHLRQAGLRGRAFVVTDEKIFPRYGATTIESLRNSNYVVESFQLPDGETTKSLASAQLLYDWLADNKAERIDAVVALGGGVVGDIAGFTAATFLRGMPLVQAPTTVLSQIDSSIGGKVGVNHLKGKNLIGAFHPARLIVADVETLRSLSPRLLADGWSEAIKCAMILDAELLDVLDANAAALCDPTSPGFGSDLLVDIITRCAQHKMRVVLEDEREANLRMILNYGHTIAQGIEAALNYESLLHGEAVSIGMTGAAEISIGTGLLDKTSAARQRQVLTHFKLPIALPADVPKPRVEDVLDRMAQDKKSRGSRISWVLLDRIGHASISSDVPATLVRDTVERLISGVGPG